MKTIDISEINSNTYRGKPRGYYDPSPVEMFFTKIGQEIFKFTDNNQHKTPAAITTYIARDSPSDTFDFQIL